MIFTLGHSTLSEEEFAAVARGMDVIIDVRSHPGSRHVPHFNREAMETWLPERGFRYEWWPGLGGWRSDHGNLRWLTQHMAAHGVNLSAYAEGFPKQRINTKLPETDKPTWTTAGFYDYSWFMTLAEFLGAAELLAARFGAPQLDNAAIVCCEGAWFKCHRSMIADHLHWRGIWVAHLPVKPPKRETTPRFKDHGDVIGNRLERYDPRIIEVWKQWAGTAAA